MNNKLVFCVAISIFISITLCGTIFLLIIKCQLLPSRQNTQPDYIQPPAKPYVFDYSWNESNTYIAHAFGAINGDTYTNSLEAFHANYDKGYRVFEVDFDVSIDKIVIAAHDQTSWRNNSKTPDGIGYTSKNFKNSLIFNKYHALLGTEVIDLMAEYPDIYIVTDTKYYDSDTVNLQFNQLVQYAQNNHPETLDRIIPQIYTEDMLDIIMKIYPFHSVIFTLYQTEWTPDSVLDFCQQSGIRFITTWGNNINKNLLETWDTLGIKVAAHTINDELLAKQYLNMGVDAIYTDNIAP